MNSAVVKLATTDSTNDDIHRLAAEGAPDGTAVVARTMSRGRGSRGRKWHAGEGGLWLSVLRRPTAAVETGVLSLRTGLVMAAELERSLGRRLALKWPNDIMVGERKVAGVLCEMRWQGDRAGWVVLGVGCNVTNRLPSELESRATTLARLVPGITVEDILAQAVAALRRLDVDAPLLRPDELARFARRDWLEGKTLLRPIRGTIRGVAPEGFLMVESPGGASHSIGTADLVLG